MKKAWVPLNNPPTVQQHPGAAAWPPPPRVGAWRPSRERCCAETL